MNCIAWTAEQGGGAKAPPPNNIVIHTFLREMEKAELEKLASAPSIKTSLRGPCIVLFRFCQFVFFKYLKNNNSRKKIL